NVSQCPNFILEDPGRIAGYLAAYEKNKAALFETTDKMTIIGENFKKRLRADRWREIAARSERKTPLTSAGFLFCSDPVTTSFSSFCASGFRCPA
uniref:hypothetical protein n=1 Tax=Alistipes shahii TaxID=328814 RepID=UPI003FEF7673